MQEQMIWIQIRALFQWLSWMRCRICVFWSYNWSFGLGCRFIEVQGAGPIFVRSNYCIASWITIPLSPLQCSWQEEKKWGWSSWKLCYWWSVWNIENGSEKMDTVDFIFSFFSRFKAMFACNYQKIKKIELM